MNDDLIQRLQALFATKPDATRVAMPKPIPSIGPSRGYESTPAVLAAEDIAAIEKFRANPYPDQGGTPTIGYGFTGPSITMQSAPWTEPQAYDSLLTRVRSDSARMADEGVAPTPALLSAAYNLGYGGLRKTGALREAKAGNWKAAADSLESAYHVKGKPSTGLKKRRAEEAAAVRATQTAKKRL